MVLVGSGMSGVSATGSVAAELPMPCAGTSLADEHVKCRKCTSLTAGTMNRCECGFRPCGTPAPEGVVGASTGARPGQLPAAWSWLHKLRRAMVGPDRDRLNGCVEVDETCVGGEEEGVRGRQTEDQAIVVVAAEQDGRGIGRIRLRRVPDASSQSLHPFIEESVRPGAVVHTGMEGLSQHRQEGLHSPGQTAPCKTFLSQKLLILDRVMLPARQRQRPDPPQHVAKPPVQMSSANKSQ